MKRMILCAALILFIKCSGGDTSNTVSRNIIDNALTLELTIGEENLPDEYLIARPRRLIVDNDNRILIFDERSIKIFDENGSPVKIVGGPGEGPGEFGEILRNLSISLNGYLLVQERNSYSLFSPEHGFIEKKLFATLPYYDYLKDNYKIDLNWSVEFKLIGDNGFIISANDQYPANYNDDGVYFHHLFYEDNESLLELVSYKKVNSVTVRRGSSYGSTSLSQLGNMYYSLLPNARILYTHTGFDSEIRDGLGYLTMHVIDKDGSNKKIFEWEYNPILIEESYIDNYKIGLSFNNERPLEAENKIKDMLREKKYEAPVPEIFIDGNYLFIAMGRKSSRPNNVYDIDVLNVETGEYLSTFAVDFSPEYIKNGYLYRRFTGNEKEFARIEKYKLDPKVYGN